MDDVSVNRRRVLRTGTVALPVAGGRATGRRVRGRQDVCERPPARLAETETDWYRTCPDEWYREVESYVGALQAPWTPGTPGWSSASLRDQAVSIILPGVDDVVAPGPASDMLTLVEATSTAFRILAQSQRFQNTVGFRIAWNANLPVQAERAYDALEETTGRSMSRTVGVDGFSETFEHGIEPLFEVVREVLPPQSSSATRERVVLVRNLIERTLPAIPDQLRTAPQVPANYVRALKANLETYAGTLSVLEATLSDSTAPTPEGIVVAEDLTGDGSTDVRLRNDRVFFELHRDDLAEQGSLQVSTRAGRGADRDLVGRISTAPKNPYTATESDVPSFRSLRAFEVTEDRERVGAYRVTRTYEYEHNGISLLIDWRARLHADDRFVVTELTLENVDSESVLVDQDPGDIHDGINLVNGIGLRGRSASDDEYRFHLAGLGTAAFSDHSRWTPFDGVEWATLFDSTDAVTVGFVDGTTPPEMWITEGSPTDRFSFLAGETELAAGESASYVLAFGFHAGGPDAPETGRRIFQRATERAGN